jgi:hypothetical protein
MEGSVGVSLVDQQGGVLTLKVTFPTAAADINDYIWTDEVDAGFTNKVVFRQGASIPTQRVRSIKRCGSDARWDCQGPDRYEIEVDLLLGRLHRDDPIEIAFLWPDHESRQMTDLGVASV